MLNALNWLRINNPLYSGITVNATNIDENLSELHLQINSGKDREVCPISGKNGEAYQRLSH